LFCEKKKIYSVTVFDAVSRSYSDSFSLHQPMLKAIYLPSIHRVLFVSQSQSMYLIHPEYKTATIAVKSVPVNFVLASNALSLSKRSHLGQIIVGGEAVCLFKVHRIKQSVSHILARKSKVVISKSMESDLSCIKQLDALSFSRSIVVRASSVESPKAMEDIIREWSSSAAAEQTDLEMLSLSNPSLSPKPSSSSSSVKPSPKQAAANALLKRQESAFLDEEGFQNVIRDLERPMIERSALLAASSPTISRPSPPVAPPTRKISAPPSPSPTTPAPVPSQQQLLQNNASSTGALIRNAYMVKEKVRVRGTAPEDCFPFQVETDSAGQIGWGRKEENEFVFFDLTGKEILRLDQNVMMQAKKNPRRVTSITMPKDKGLF
jgi:hypothetical protein